MVIENLIPLVNIRKIIMYGFIQINSDTYEAKEHQNAHSKTLTYSNMGGADGTRDSFFKTFYIIKLC